MSAPLIAACLWALASTIVALLPMRAQMIPGLTLLIAAPVLLVWIAMTHGALVTLGCLLAVLSLFRNPLIYFVRRALGKPVHIPEELRR